MVYYPANKRYEKKNIIKVTVGFNRSTEPELAAKIESEESRASYLKRLVREDVEREKRSK